MNTTNLSYFAGFFDGEGSIGIMKSRVRGKNWSPEHRLQISIGQNDGGTMDWIVENFGGHLHRVKRDNSYYWLTSNRHAYELLKTISPYLKYKKPQADLAIQFYDECYKVRKNPVPQETLEKRELFFLEMKKLKHIIVEAKLVSVKKVAGSTTERANPTGM